MVLAAQALARDAEAIAAHGRRRRAKGALYRTYPRRGPFEREPDDDRQYAAPRRSQVVVKRHRQPDRARAGRFAGYAVERSYYKLDGTKVDSGAACGRTIAS